MCSSLDACSCFQTSLHMVQQHLHKYKFQLGRFSKLQVWMGHLLDPSLDHLLSVRSFAFCQVFRESGVSQNGDVVQRVIWNNKDITVEQRSIFKKDLFSKGIIAIGDLLSDAGIFVKGVKVLNVNLSAIEYFSLISIVDAIPMAINDQTKHVTRSSLYE